MGEYVFDYDGNTYKFKKFEEDKEKYIVFACAKNEDPYILEWVKHYLSLGFDKIIIADNNDSPFSLNELLKDYVSDGSVQIFECNGLQKFQLYIYNMFLEEGNYKWCAYFDCDEFLELTTHANIKDFLSGIKEDCVLINWIVFGPDGNVRKSDEPLSERFKTPVLPVPFFKENFYVKPIIRGTVKGAHLSNTHCPSYVTSLNLGGYVHIDYGSHVYFPPRYKYAFIRHYYTKSFDEWMSNKIVRGWPDEMPKILKPTNYFIVDKNQDFDINKYTKGFFVDNSVFEPASVHKNFDEIMNNYEMVHLFTTTKNPYGLLMHLFSLMKEYKDHLFVISDDFIDDSLYGLILSYAMISGNRLSFAFNDDEKYGIFANKTTWSKELYYYMDCQ